MKVFNISALGILGIIAGGGQLPREAIKACQESGRPFFVIGYEGQTDPETLKGFPHFVTEIGKIGKVLDKLKEEKIQDIVIIGNFRRPSWFELKPDAVAVKWLAGAAKSIFGDDSLLKVISLNLEKEGFHLHGIEEIIPINILVPFGQIGEIEPNDQDWIDIEHGIKMAQLLGQADIGQSVIVQQGLVLGVEAIEGTDALIERCGRLQRAGPGGILIKLLKPNQEGRLDRPVVGVKTVEQAIKAGLRGLALEANEVIACDLPKMRQLANQHHLLLIGITKDLKRDNKKR